LVFGFSLKNGIRYFNIRIIYYDYDAVWLILRPMPIKLVVIWQAVSAATTNAEYYLTTALPRKTDFCAELQSHGRAN
jgi:hypothetical protein